MNKFIKVYKKTLHIQACTLITYVSLHVIQKAITNVIYNLQASIIDSFFGL